MGMPRASRRAASMRAGSKFVPLRARLHIPRALSPAADQPQMSRGADEAAWSATARVKPRLRLAVEVGSAGVWSRLVSAPRSRPRLLEQSSPFALRLFLTALVSKALKQGALDQATSTASGPRCVA